MKTLQIILLSLILPMLLNAQHIQKALPYSYDALEPFIDAQTMEIHFSKHHAGYINKLNKAVEGTEYTKYSLLDLQYNITEKTPVNIKNNAGGSWNHEFFWQILAPAAENSMPKGKLLEAINRDFGSFEAFKKAFAKAASEQFGSGWAWLIINDGKLQITTSSNQENPLMPVAKINGTPLLTIDVWEHAYYLKYNNRRSDYIDAFFNVINWGKVQQLFEEAEK
jgi:Fe-Mn family superoxide dismutase